MEAIVGKITTMLKSKLHGLKGKAMDQGKRKVMKYKVSLFFGGIDNTID